MLLLAPFAWILPTSPAVPRGGGVGPRRCVAPRMQGSGSIFGSDIIKIEEGASAYLMGVNIRQNKYKTLESTWTVETSLDELSRLCETAGLEVLGREYQTM